MMNMARAVAAPSSEESASMPRVLYFTFAVDAYVTQGIERHRLTWVFFLDNGTEHIGTQDRAAASEEDHRAWIQGQADSYAVATSEPNSDAMGV